MLRIIEGEFKKFFYHRIVILSIIFWFFISILLIPAFTNLTSVFELQLKLLDLCGAFFITSFFISIASYVFALELDYDTLKIIKAKKTPLWKIYFAKYLVGISYCALLLLLMFFGIFLLGQFLLPLAPLNSEQFNLQVPSVWGSFGMVLAIYAAQWVGTFFIMTMGFTLTLVFQNKVLPVVGVPIIIYLLSLFNVIKHRFKGLYLLLPINSDSILLEIRNQVISSHLRLLILIGYCVLLTYIGLYAFKRQSVKN